ILRTAWGKRTVVATPFAQMDAAFEILDIGRGAGHLNFASGVSTHSPDTDYTGRYGFRCIRDPERVREVLEQARRADYPQGVIRRSWVADYAIANPPYTSHQIAHGGNQAATLLVRSDRDAQKVL